MKEEWDINTSWNRVSQFFLWKKQFDAKLIAPSVTQQYSLFSFSGPNNWTERWGMFSVTMSVSFVSSSDTQKCFESIEYDSSFHVSFKVWSVWIELFPLFTFFRPPHHWWFERFLFSLCFFFRHNCFDCCFFSGNTLSTVMKWLVLTFVALLSTLHFDTRANRKTFSN